MGATRVAIVPEGLLNAAPTPLNTSSSSSTSSPSIPFLRLPHPRTGVPCLFLPHVTPPTPDTPNGTSQLLEVQTVAPDASRSWFLENHVVSDGRLLLFTPIDAAFILIPILRAVFDVSATRFRALDDIFEEAGNKLGDPSSSTLSTEAQSDIDSSSTKGKEKHIRVLASDLMLLSELTCVKRAMRQVCDVQDISDSLAVYRYSESNVLNLVRAKVTKLADPAVFASFRILSREVARTGLVGPASGFESAEETRDRHPGSSATADGTEEKASVESLLTLARLKSSVDVLSQYLPPDLALRLLDSYDFTPLEAHLKTLAPEDTPAVTDPSSGRRGGGGAAKAGRGGQDKSRKVANGKKEKKETGPNASRGVEKLKKADTAGMTKLSSFFTKKEKEK